MIDHDYLRLMLRYNRWMNRKLYDCAARLDETRRHRDLGAFFKSLHGTFEHLVYGDTAWLYRFTGRSIEHLRPDQALYPDFAALRAERERLDDALDAWGASVSAAWLAQDFTYYSPTYARHYTKPAWLLVTHLFNHQTHHRGQATTLLLQLGIDPGATDLPAVPADFL